MADGRQTVGRQSAQKLVFSKTRLASIPSPESGRVSYYDSRTPGLALVVSKSGSKVFYVYKWAAGRPQRVRLGRFPDLTPDQAQHLARSILGDIARGQDPQAEKVKARNVPTLRALFDKWLAVYAKLHRKRWADDVRQFEKYLTDLHGRRLDTIRPTDVAVWHGGVGREYGPVQANRTLGLLTTLYNKAPEVIGYDGPNPCSKVKRFAEQSRDRFLQANELGPFFRAVEAEPELYRDFFLVALFTGARRSNVQSMQWADIDFNSSIWRIPETKAGVPVVIPLSDAALEILRRRWSGSNGSEWVFPADSRPGHLVEPRKSWQRILRTAGLENLKIHDLRRSLGSWQALTGSSLLVIAKSLGHLDTSATEIYSRLTLDPVRVSVNTAAVAMLAAGRKKEDFDDGQTE